MSVFEEFLNKIEDNYQKDRVSDILNWVEDSYPDLQEELKWNQPMFTHHGTYIIGFSTAKQHISIAPEYKTMEQFKDAIQEAGYSQTNGLFRIKFSDEVNYDLLRAIIDFNMEDKKECKTFWRK
ncbi:iron chaperone [Macrococcus lamae]|uniref:Iron chaperone n=1 Tax=Macrococcus lamae TaxID=198484 RepID=A0A4R6BWD1_9STAP|nr:DUF1801 domain-containing protein [Macrococcus lamae]TDM12736.1 iron chaperone [Macrococcus lamae]